MPRSMTNLLGSATIVSGQLTCQKYIEAHIDGHFEELKYSCNLCEKRFKWRQQLK